MTNAITLEWASRQTSVGTNISNEKLKRPWPPDPNPTGADKGGESKNLNKNCIDIRHTHTLKTHTTVTVEVWLACALGEVHAVDTWTTGTDWLSCFKQTVKERRKHAAGLLRLAAWVILDIDHFSFSLSLPLSLCIFTHCMNQNVFGLDHTIESHSQINVCTRRLRDGKTNHQKRVHTAVNCNRTRREKRWSVNKKSGKESTNVVKRRVTISKKNSPKKDFKEKEEIGRQLKQIR